MRILVSILFFMGSLIAYGADSMTLNVDTNSEQFQVKLPANPTTGFQWTVKHYDKTILQLSNSQYIAPQTQLMGAGGEMVFTFKLVGTSPKSTSLEFSYARSWEPNSATLQQVNVEFKKNPSSEK